MTPEVARWLKDAPKAIRVGAFDYQLKFHPDWLKNELGENSWGLCDFANRTLHVANLNGAPSVRDVAGTVWHEILHAVWDSHNLGKKATEEDVVRAYEYGFVCVVRDNPKLIPWLVKGIL